MASNKRISSSVIAQKLHCIKAASSLADRGANGLPLPYRRTR
eukprot:CAMPEP_0180682054 /NCGR_PEP_ID=MMETSP1037_2-20121125/70335_1 /TAXON_ID=632150 /ORGANISM="Azadinium spinosum, Strain 3D9" /LENGTH=41 /DNA_ID= /DNA_START= /DNA_END= /DNA_ORIENTATION=